MTALPLAPDAPHDLPSGADLRASWPERQHLLRAKNIRMGHHSLADAEFPYLPDFIRRNGGAMPERFTQMTESDYSKGVLAFWQRFVSERAVSYETGAILANAAIRYGFATEWWEYEGCRLYALDPTTAHALLHTEVDDFPTEHVRFPVRSFYIRFPSDLGWTIDVRNRPDFPRRKAEGAFSGERTDPRKPSQDELHEIIAGAHRPPPADHPEPVQPLEGVHLTVDGPVGGPVERLQVVISGRSSRDMAADHVIWGDIRFATLPTLGDVFRQWMEPNDNVVTDTKVCTDPRHTPGAMQTEAGVLVRGGNWNATGTMGLDQQVLRMAIGAVLYITSTHPHLRTIPPANPATLRKAERSGDPGRARYARERSRYAITYVGGPEAGFRAGKAAPEEETLQHRRPPRPHVRAGHMRHVWLGARGSEARHTEIRWIPPVMVGSWDRIAAWNALKGYRYVIGKTRPAQPVGETHAPDESPGKVGG